MDQLKSNHLCNNCGKYGHLFHQCKLPITSYGIILFRSSEKGPQFLMIRRKDSFGYIDFIRGKYSCQQISQIQKSVNEMSVIEKKRLLEEPFEALWRDLWGDNNKSQYRGEEITSSKKFEQIKQGLLYHGELVTLEDIISKSTTSWSETEWEFPKGRRNYQEKDLDCALREFEEETGLSSHSICIVENLLPFEEMFIGSNHKSYKHKYFLAYMSDEMNIKEEEGLSNFQTSEVSKLEWKTTEECLACIRPYNLEKKQLISNIYKILQEYRLYS